MKNSTTPIAKKTVAAFLLTLMYLAVNAKTTYRSKGWRVCSY